MQFPSTCDYLIVGAGSAGCVLANRLSSVADASVVLVEAGPPDDSWLIRTPAAVGALMKHKRFNWNFSTVPQAHLGGRRMPMPRGRTLGGTSSINGMVYIRGHRADYEEWGRLAGPEWSYAAVLPYFMRSECNEVWRDSPFHRTDGPMNVKSILPHNPLVDRFLDAAHSLGYPVCEDFNGASMEGFGARQATIRAGRRESAATAFLRPIQRRRNLTILTDCFVRRVVIENGRALGIELQRGSTVHRIDVAREIILAAGSFGSPALLMHSGVGDRYLLRNLGVPVTVDLPAVGLGLTDHLSAAVVMRTHNTQSYGLSWRTLPVAIWDVARYVIARRGPLSSNVFEAHGFVRTQAGTRLPDLQIIFMPAYRNPSGFPIPLGHGYGINVALLAPKSRGRVRIASADPREPPLIDPNFLSEADDLMPMIEGLKLARGILNAPAFSNFGSWEVLPGPHIQSDGGLADYIRSACGTVFHPVGTCRMGSDTQSVVDEQLRVRHIVGLRVADASVFPTQIHGNTNAAVIMIAEKAADLILGSAPPACFDPQRTGVEAVN